MALHTYNCAKCGREKQVDLEPGQSIEDVKTSCGCGGKSKNKNSLDLLNNNESGCGCGGNSCGCN